MRIGVHSGNISCGIIGTIKWQYDIWSTDVDTANKMETEGTAGMVHITKATKDLLRKNYKASLSAKIVNGERTYLVEPDSSSEVVPNGVAKTVVENHTSIIHQEESDQDSNGTNGESSENQRRPTIYIKRTSTAQSELNKMNNVQNVRSNSLSPRTTLDEACDINESDPPGKRHTFPSSEQRNVLGSFHRRPSGNARFSTDRRLTGNERKRRTAFMNNNIKRYKERLEKTNRELEDTIENMLLSKFEQWFKASDMYRIILVFKDLKSEADFVRMPDPLFKYYLISVILLLVLVFIIENLTQATEWEVPPWPFFLTFAVIIFLFLPLCWTHYFWTKYIAKFENDLPTNRIISALYYTSQFITNNVIARFLIYTVVYVLFCICVLTEWVDCYKVGIAPSDSSDNFNVQKQSFFLLLSFTNNANANPKQPTHCIIPWHMTETFALAIIMSFIFLRMYMWLKLLYALAIASAYAYCILQFGGKFFGDSQTFNYDLSPQISHIMGVVFLTAVLHLVDRQTEYMNRIDHMWYKKLIDKEQQASNVHIVNNMLLKNILPIHVADLYLNVNRHSSEEMYNESYNDAAVMFASITNFSVEEMGQGFLRIMSAIISEFDMLLVENSFGRPIEKIKIAKWTYMAACGLAPGLGDGENMRRDPTDHVVISLLKFAACLMQKLKKINAEIKQEMKLRIGISNGFIAAGVVGSKKPLYDIWGDPVNMASRMDTTGKVDHIQVLKPTAEILENFGYVCHYRGEIEVRGRDTLVATYFVALDDDFQLIRREDNTE